MPSAKDIVEGLQLTTCRYSSHMHQTLRIPEIFRNIFGRSPSTTASTPEGDSHNADLAALSRTCKTLKELALDLLWEELDDVSPLARCLPDACRLSDLAQTPYHLDRGAVRTRFHFDMDIISLIFAPFDSAVMCSADH